MSFLFGGNINAGVNTGLGGGVPNISSINSLMNTPQLPQQPSTQVNTPAYGQYQAPDPYQAYQGPSTLLQGNLDKMSQTGSGLMDPNSDYYKRLSASMQRQIGGQSAAGQRAAALRGAWSGMGAGASPEMMMTQAGLGQAGLEAAGQAQADLALRAPGMGAQMLGQTFSPLMGIEQLGEQSRQYGYGQAQQAGQYGHGAAEGARQFGVGVGLQQQELAGQQAWQQAQLQQNQQQMQYQAAMQQQQNQMAMMEMMAGMGGF
jgi:hypothetical protein